MAFDMSARDIELCLDGEHRPARYERIRNFTRYGLIDISGDPNPGTGREKLYPPTAVMTVLVLEELSKLGCRVAGRKNFVEAIAADAQLFADLQKLAAVAGENDERPEAIDWNFPIKGVQ